MAKNSKKNLFVRILLNPKILALTGLIIIILISFPLAKNISQRYRVSQEIKNLEQEIADMEDSNVNLKKFISYLTSDQFVEKEARLNFGLKKPGEEAAVIKTEKQGETTAGAIFNVGSSGGNQPVGPISNPKKWWEYFFK